MFDIIYDKNDVNDAVTIYYTPVSVVDPVS